MHNILVLKRICSPLNNYFMSNYLVPPYFTFQLFNLEHNYCREEMLQFILSQHLWKTQWLNPKFQTSPLPSLILKSFRSSCNLLKIFQNVPLSFPTLVVFSRGQPVADLGFHRGDVNPRGDYHLNVWQNICRKLYENERNWTESVGVRVTSATTVSANLCELTINDRVRIYKL